MDETGVIRKARPGDEAALTRLAQLDGIQRLDHLHTLLAEVDGEIRAALPLNGGQPASDPFRPTATLIAMLSLRAADLASREAPPRGHRVWLPRRPRTVRELLQRA